MKRLEMTDRERSILDGAIKSINEFSKARVDRILGNCSKNIRTPLFMREIQSAMRMLLPIATFIASENDEFNFDGFAGDDIWEDGNGDEDE